MERKLSFFINLFMFSFEKDERKLKLYCYRFFVDKFLNWE